jgi:hypothetical protein
MNQLYNEPLKAYEFFCEARDEVLAKACTAAGATCLEYPPLISPGALFTPAEFMLAADGLHPTSDYGLEVLRQIVNSAERQSTGSISSP